MRLERESITVRVRRSTSTGRRECSVTSGKLGIASTCFTTAMVGLGFGRHLGGEKSDGRFRIPADPSRHNKAGTIDMPKKRLYERVDGKHPQIAAKVEHQPGNWVVADREEEPAGPRVDERQGEHDDDSGQCAISDEQGLSLDLMRTDQPRPPRFTPS